MYSNPSGPRDPESPARALGPAAREERQGERQRERDGKGQQREREVETDPTTPPGRIVQRIQTIIFNKCL